MRPGNDGGGAGGSSNLSPVSGGTPGGSAVTSASTVCLSRRSISGSFASRFESRPGSVSARFLSSGSSIFSAVVTMIWSGGIRAGRTAGAGGTSATSAAG